MTVCEGLGLRVRLTLTPKPYALGPYSQGLVSRR